MTMHLHLWDKSKADSAGDYEGDYEPVEADLHPSEIFDDHIQWCGTIEIDGKKFDVELRQWTTAPGEQENKPWGEQENKP